MSSGVTLAQTGEDRVIAGLVRRLRQDRRVVVGPGDDAAVLRSESDDGHYDLFKTDVVVEGVHFLPSAPAGKVGWKAACRAVSDIAAMGGWPTHAVVTLVVPGNRKLAWVNRLYSGLERAARRFGFSIVGGETSRMPEGGSAVINVALLGRVERERCVKRSGARAGDALLVTGRLGGAGGGRHLGFVPRVDEARWLGGRFRPSAMLDLSDGLARDIPRLATASGLGVILDSTLVPRHRGCSIDAAFGDGEDYELLFTVSGIRLDELEREWRRRFPQVKLTRIGWMTRDRRIVGMPPGAGGWDHFARSRARPNPR